MGRVLESWATMDALRAWLGSWGRHGLVVPLLGARERDTEGQGGGTTCWWPLVTRVPADGEEGEQATCEESWPGGMCN